MSEFTDTVLEYNAFDVVNTLEVSKELESGMDADYQATYDFTERLLEPLMFMMSRGVAVDMDELQIVKEGTIKKAQAKREKLNELAERELNPNSPAQLRQYFYVEKGIQPYTKRNAKGSSSITCDDKALQRIARGTATRRGLPEAKLIQEIRALEKLHGTYLDIAFDQDRRFRCSYNPRGTKFGRLSSSKTIFETGMNMQNLPHVFKKFLVADPGYMLWEIDKAKAEWVVVAYVSGDANMIKVIEEGLDPHIHTAHLMTGLPKELIEEESKLVGHLTDPQEVGEIRNKMRQASFAVANAFEAADFLPRTMSIRQCGKKSNHGLNYDEGYRTFALTNEMLEAEAKKVIQLYKYKAYPGIPIWHRSIQEQLRHDRTLYNCFGRKYKFLGRWDDDLFKAAYAYIPQSSVADLVNHGIIDSYYDRSDYMLRQELLGQVHDSVLGQNPISVIEEHEGEKDIYKMYTKDIHLNSIDMAKSMQVTGQYMNRELEYGGRSFHIDNDAKVGFSWGDMKDVKIDAPIETLAQQILGVYNEFQSGA